MLFQNSTAKSMTTQKPLKEIMLDQQIVKLHEIHDRSSEVFAKSLETLKKMSSIKVSGSEQNQDRYKLFFEDLSSIEDYLISLLEDSETDKELFSREVLFRNSDKSYQNAFFRKMMTSHQATKLHLNKTILKLEDSIQILESNGFHIYDQKPKPHNILMSLKKSILEKYTLALTQMKILIEKMSTDNENVCTSINLEVEKQSFQAHKYQSKKLKDHSKHCGSIALKEQLLNKSYIEKINQLRCNLKRQNKKQKIMKQGIKDVERKELILKYENGLYEEEFTLRKNEFSLLINHLNDETNDIVLNKPRVSYQYSQRSQSCFPIIIRPKKGPLQHHQNKHPQMFNAIQDQPATTFFQDSFDS